MIFLKKQAYTQTHTSFTMFLNNFGHVTKCYNLILKDFHKAYPEKGKFKKELMKGEHWIMILILHHSAPKCSILIGQIGRWLINKNSTDNCSGKK